jgi:hypothetical protein
MDRSFILLTAAGSLLLIMPDDASSCGRRGGVIFMTAPFPEILTPQGVVRGFSIDDARTALIEYVTKGPGSLRSPDKRIMSAELREQVLNELVRDTAIEKDGRHYLSAFQIDLRGRTYSFDLTGPGYRVEYAGNFELVGDRWNAKPPEAGSWAHWK